MGQSVIGCRFRETRANRGCRLAHSWQLRRIQDTSLMQVLIITRYISVCGQGRDDPASWRPDGSEKDKMKMKELWGGKKERNRSFRPRLNEKLILKEETKENRFKVY